MATYLILNLVFFTIVLLVMVVLKKFKLSPTLLAVLAILMVLTALFDSLIIGAGIVGYDQQKLLGVYIGAAPAEDFFYAILAAVMIPSIWNITKKEAK